MMIIKKECGKIYMGESQKSSLIVIKKKTKKTKKSKN